MKMAEIQRFFVYPAFLIRVQEGHDRFRRDTHENEVKTLIRKERQSGKSSARAAETETRARAEAVEAVCLKRRKRRNTVSDDDGRKTSFPFKEARDRHPDVYIFGSGSVVESTIFDFKVIKFSAIKHYKVKYYSGNVTYMPKGLGVKILTFKVKYTRCNSRLSVGIVKLRRLTPPPLHTRSHSWHLANSQAIAEADIPLDSPPKGELGCKKSGYENSHSQSYSKLKNRFWLPPKSNLNLQKRQKSTYRSSWLWLIE